QAVALEDLDAGRLEEILQAWIQSRASDDQSANEPGGGQRSPLRFPLQQLQKERHRHELGHLALGGDPGELLGKKSLSVADLSAAEQNTEQSPGQLEQMRERKHREEDVVWSDRDELRKGSDFEDEAGEANHRAAGPARGARGVDDERN